MKELSICIPVYNQRVTQLVTTLHQQAQSCPDLTFEIVVADDHSPLYEEENRAALSDMLDVRYSSLPANSGRAHIRNYLAQQARYNRLLLLDCDTTPPDSLYISRYLQAMDHDIVVGGCTYDSTPPDTHHLLRWKYGLKYESRTADERNADANKGISTFNFMIRRDLLLHIPFNETISKYGHEDTLLGWDMKQAGYVIFHINNPLIHLGVDDTDSFLQKTDLAVMNLWQLLQNPDCPAALIDSINLLRCYQKVKRWHLKTFLTLLTRISRRLTLLNLESEHPLIPLFQWYKLGRLLEISAKA